MKLNHQSLRDRGFARPCNSLPVIVASMLCVLATSLFCGMPTAQAQDIEETQETYEARVLVTTRERALLSGELAARIDDIAVRPGASFSKGDLLIAFDCVAYKAQRETVASDFRRAEAQLKSQQRLFELRSVGELDVIIAEAERDSTLAQLRLQDVYLDRCQINAPYDGAVVEWRSQPYQIANPGDELIEIIGTDNLELELVVPSVWLSWIAEGMRFRARIEETGSVIEATIERISTDIDPVSQTLKLYAGFDAQNAALLPGMSGVAVFEGR